MDGGGEQMPSLTRGQQTLAQQFREVHVFALLGAIRLAMLWFASALQQVGNGLALELWHVAGDLAVLLRTPLVLLYCLILAALYGHLLRRRLIAPWILDVLGGWVVVSLLGHFLKINILMLTDSVHPQLLLGQVVTYLLFFVVAWGWIFWRLDRMAGPVEQQIIHVPGTSGRAEGFDYFYGSLMSLLEGKLSTFQGGSRLGKMLVAIHSFMVLDLAAIAVARFYQLVQKSL